MQVIAKTTIDGFKEGKIYDVEDTRYIRYHIEQVREYKINGERKPSNFFKLYNKNK